MAAGVRITQAGQAMRLAGVNRSLQNARNATGIIHIPCLSNKFNSISLTAPT